MKSLRTNLVLLFSTIIFFGVIYPLFIWSIGLLLPQQANGLPIIANGNVIGYRNIGQSFTEAKYFWGRPSACNYNPINAAATNLGPTNPVFLNTVEQRINTFMVENPGIKKSEIPSDLVTSSASGIDPDISPQAALIQIPRIAKARKIDQAVIEKLVDEKIKEPVLGPAHVNVLELNLLLDKLAELNK
ncbi:MAG: potassium-transporting ATPase subunit KdpC [Ignavibacteriaceae bacterium]